MRQVKNKGRLKNISIGKQQGAWHMDPIFADGRGSLRGTLRQKERLRGGVVNEGRVMVLNPIRKRHL